MPTYTATDVGEVRDVNEDDVLARSFASTELLAVADGMGGHSAGDVASETALDELHAVLEEAIGPGADREAILADAIERANDAIRAKASEDRARADMGTTLVAALVRDGEAVIGNVGDSRAYLLGEGIEQITVDQSLVRELVEAGEITEEEARTHPRRHVLSQALGTEASVEPDFYRTALEGGTLLLCSDGLTEEVDDGTIRAAVAPADSLAAAGEALIERAKANGGSDNVTVALYRE